MRTYSVPGISCGHCKTAIEGEVGKVVGVETVDVDIESKTVKVVLADSVTDDEIRGAIDIAGYDVAEVAR
jgi:copper chaperone